jgi:hypothetical protein
MADLVDFLQSLGVGLKNGSNSFSDQAKWATGGYGNAPQPAPYAGGTDYPSRDDANAYVRNNWPSDGHHLMHDTRAGTFYTPAGAAPPPGGRGPSIGEEIDGAPSMRQLVPFLSLLLNQYKAGR